MVPAVRLTWIVTSVIAPPSNAGNGSWCSSQNFGESSRTSFRVNSECKSSVGDREWERKTMTDDTLVQSLSPFRMRELLSRFGITRVWTWQTQVCLRDAVCGGVCTTLSGIRRGVGVCVSMPLAPFITCRGMVFLLYSIHNVRYSVTTV